MKNNIMIIITILLLIIVGGGAFFAGIKYQQYALRNRMANFQFGTGQQGQRRNGQGMGNANRLGFRPVNGEIISADEKSITVKLQDGSSKIILITDKTSINKASEGTIDDLKTGEKVAVFGETNQDGSVNAQNIQLNPIARGNQP